MRFNRGYEPVAFSGDRLDVARYLGGVAKRVPQATNGVVQAVVELDIRVFRPERTAEFFARYHLSRTAQQGQQDL